MIHVSERNGAGVYAVPGPNHGRSHPCLPLTVIARHRPFHRRRGGSWGSTSLTLGLGQCRACKWVWLRKTSSRTYSTATCVQPGDNSTRERHCRPPRRTYRRCRIDDLHPTMVRDGDGTLYVIPNSGDHNRGIQPQSADFSVATINVNVDFSANPDDEENEKLLKQIAMDVRNGEEFEIFSPGSAGSGRGRSQGSQIIFPVVFKTDRRSNALLCADSSAASLDGCRGTPCARRSLYLWWSVRRIEHCRLGA